MSAYAVVRITITDEAAFEKYKQMVPPTIELFGGRYIARSDEFEVLEGSESRQRIVLVEFPDLDTLRRWYESEEYAPSKRQRQASAETDMVILEGCA
jgi:uncharacterized protein (DUF1330 family)